MRCARFITGTIPVAAPFPDVPGDVVQTEPVGRKLGDRCGAGEAIVVGIEVQESAPPRCWPTTFRAWTHRRRQRSAPHLASALFQSPTPLRSAAAFRPNWRKQQHHTSISERRDSRLCRRHRFSAPPDGASWHRVRSSTTPGVVEKTRRANARRERSGPARAFPGAHRGNPCPGSGGRSAIVLYAVSLTNRANWRLVTSV